MDKTQNVKNIVVTYKNGILREVNDTVVVKSVADTRLVDIPENATFYVNTQGLSQDNIIKVNALAEGHVGNTTSMSPKDVTPEEYFNVAPTYVKAAKGKTMEMTQDDVNALNTLLETYNKATLNKQLVRLTLKL